MSPSRAAAALAEIAVQLRAVVDDLEDDAADEAMPPRVAARFLAVALALEQLADAADAI